LPRIRHAVTLNGVPERKRGHLLATLLFTDIVGSTALADELGDRRWRELLARHHAIVRRHLRAFNGRELDTAGDGFFAAFTSPADAVRCACAVSDAVRELGIEIRAGLHMGEGELSNVPHRAQSATTPNMTFANAQGPFPDGPIPFPGPTTPSL